MQTLETFFVFLDILGFKNVVYSNSTADLQKIIERFQSDFRVAVDKSRTYNNDKINIDSINFRLISDSIIIWSENDTFVSFRHILEATIALLSYGLKNGFPLRGAMTHGEIIVAQDEGKRFFGQETVYGKALVEACEFEKSFEWSGCIIAPSAWSVIKKIWSKELTSRDNANAFFDTYPYLTWYKTPIKSQKDKGVHFKSAIAINWNSFSAWDDKQSICPFIVRNSFSAYRNEVDSSDKLNNTLRFLDYTTKLQDYFFAPREHKIKACSKIPVPTDNYQLDIE